jgi:hypothetical protein
MDQIQRSNNHQLQNNTFHILIQVLPHHLSRELGNLTLLAQQSQWDNTRDVHIRTIHMHGQTKFLADTLDAMDG